MITQRLTLLLTLLLGAACGGTPVAGPPQVAAAPAVQQLVLAADPGPATDVVDQKLAGPSDKAIVVGRIAGIVKGLAVFTLMDTELPYCGERNPEDNCKTPWDYCCESAPTRTSNSMLVEIRGADGKPVATPALPDLRLLDVVKVTGKVSKDDYGNHVLIATGLFRVQRPELPAGLDWPQ